MPGINLVSPYPNTSLFPHSTSLLSPFEGREGRDALQLHTADEREKVRKRYLGFTVVKTINVCS
jgi:hypothetical protein